MIREGVNRYDPSKIRKSASQRLFEKTGVVRDKSKPCVFVSHISSDIKAAIEIGKYVKSFGIDIYLDVEDQDLQKAAQDQNHALITEFIDAGIFSSTDLLVIISEATKASWWVPYEIGFGKAQQLTLGALPLKSVRLPSYLKLAKTISGFKSLDTYLEKIALRGAGSDILKKTIVEMAFGSSSLKKIAGNHPMDPYLEKS